MTCITSNFDVGTHGDSEGADHSLRRAHDPHRQHHRRRPRDGESPALPSNECFELDRDLEQRHVERGRGRRKHAEPHRDRVPGSLRLRRRRQPRERRHRPAVDRRRRHRADVRVQHVQRRHHGSRQRRACACCSRTRSSRSTTNAAAGHVTIRDAANAAVDIGAAGDAVTDGYIGAVRSTANWTANWTYGIDAGNRGIAPWWE